ncbi:TRAP transporter large permease [Phaeovulum sp.]|uniref:TRAP transporter large permease n=1 Tax=Phaeovulum sp. TaxID=2934796 RepID=UPI003566C4C3
MSPIEIGLISVAAIVVLIYLGVYIPVALGMVSLAAVWLIRDNPQLALNLLKSAVAEGVREYTFATIPLFTFMGLIVSKAGLGKDVYVVMNSLFRRVRGGIGMATVGANALFAAVTGSSIASASVFTKVAVPEMLSLGYTARFAVGVVGGSSVLGMIIPPSAMLIIYALVVEQSVGDMFLAGIVPGILLTFAYIFAIMFMCRFTPNFVGGNARGQQVEHAGVPVELSHVLGCAGIVALVGVVLGGIYTGKLTPIESGAAGATLALFIAVARRTITAKGFWNALLETGHITASILFLITAAALYQRMLGIADLPNSIAEVLSSYELGFAAVMVIYVLMMLFLGTILDTASIILIVVPLFLPIVEPMGVDLVWFGIVTVVGAEIGLLTPPLGISCFVIKSTLDRPDVLLKDVFMGALPFAGVMLIVLILLIVFPVLSIGIL